MTDESGAAGPQRDELDDELDAEKASARGTREPASPIAPDDEVAPSADRRQRAYDPDDDFDPLPTPRRPGRSDAVGPSNLVVPEFEHFTTGGTTIYFRKKVDIRWHPRDRDLSMSEVRHTLFKVRKPTNPIVSVGGLLHRIIQQSPTTPAEIEASLRMPAGVPKIMTRVTKGQLGERIDSEISFYSVDFALAPAERGVEPDPEQRDQLPARGRASQEVLAAMFIDQTDRELRPGERQVLQVNRPIAAPPCIAEQLAGEIQTGAPSCVGIQRCPMVDENGDLVTANIRNEAGELTFTNGFSIERGLFFDIGDISLWPATATLEEGAKSMKWLQDQLLADFPFEIEADRSIAVLMFLTVVQRRLMDFAPSFLINAPEYSSGKTALADLLSATIVGEPISPSAWMVKEEEMEKRLLAALMRGRQLNVLDNLPIGQDLNSNSLALVHTSTKFEGRVLGETRIISVPTQTTFIATGNNVTMTGDLSTRFLTCRIVPNVDNPDQRNFTRKDLAAWAAENRATVLRHCLTVLMAGLRAMKNGTPEPETGFKTRFGRWDKMVLAPALLCGLPSIDEAIQRQKAADPIKTQRHDLLTAWLAFYPTPTPRTLHEILNDVNDERPKQQGDFEEWTEWASNENETPRQTAARNLYNAFRDLAHPKRPEPRQLGYKLRSMVDARTGRMTLKSEQAQFGAKWFVVEEADKDETEKAAQDGTKCQASV